MAVSTSGGLSLGLRVSGMFRGLSVPQKDSWYVLKVFGMFRDLVVSVGPLMHWRAISMSEAHHNVCRAVRLSCPDTGRCHALVLHVQPSETPA